MDAVDAKRHWIVEKELLIENELIKSLEKNPSLKALIENAENNFSKNRGRTAQK